MRIGYGRAGESVSAFEPRETSANSKRTETQTEIFLRVRIRVSAGTTDAQIVADADAQIQRLPEMMREALAHSQREYLRAHA